MFLPASKITGKLERDAKHLLEEELITGGVAGATLYLGRFYSSFISLHLFKNKLECFTLIFEMYYFNSN